MNVAFVYVTDERGFALALHSALSLILSQPNRCDLHLFCYRFAPALSAATLQFLDRNDASLVLHPISDAAVEQHQTCGHVTTPSLLKIAAIERLVGRYDRIVYLDNDMLVFGDLRIAAIAFGTAPIAAVIDMDLSDTGALRNSGWAHGGTGHDAGDYFNVGFMVVEARNWVTGDFQRAYAAALDRHDAGCGYKLACTSIEQCALNSVFQNDWVKLPATYNFQASAKFTGAWQTALVRHYCGPRKFLPVAPFRNDGRDMRLLRAIGRAIGLPVPGWPLAYDFMFQLNRLRKRHGAAHMRRFLRAMVDGADHRMVA